MQADWRKHYRIAFGHQTVSSLLIDRDQVQDNRNTFQLSYAADMYNPPFLQHMPNVRSLARLPEIYVITAASSPRQRCYPTSRPSIAPIQVQIIVTLTPPPLTSRRLLTLHIYLHAGRAFHTPRRTFYRITPPHVQSKHQSYRSPPSHLTSSAPS